MPEPFHGPTYVAFSDLCGFKKLMENKDNAHKALDHFFQSVYDIAEQKKSSISAIAVSDCVISWVSSMSANRNDILAEIVEFVSSLHKKLLKKRYLMQTAIAYGDFHYENRIQLNNLQKEMYVGPAYLTAYLEHKKVTEGGIILIDAEDTPQYKPEFWRKIKKSKGQEYFWSADEPKQIDKIISERKIAGDWKYERLKDIYQGKI